jgi:hypothetical protein
MRVPSATVKDSGFGSDLGRELHKGTAFILDVGEFSSDGRKFLTV